MRTFKLLVSYDGTNYFGWQAQSGHRTIQETIEAAIARVTGQSVRILGQRPDRCRRPCTRPSGWRSPRYPLNARSFTPGAKCRPAAMTLPFSMFLKSTMVFIPFAQVQRKRYRYLIHDGPVREVFRRNYCWHYQPRPTRCRGHASLSPSPDRHPRFQQLRNLRRAAQRQRAHDLSILPCSGAGGMNEDWITIEVEADGFLYNMVRAIVGTLVEVGRGVQERNLAGRGPHMPPIGSQAGPTAPPQGLFLVKVDY